MSRKLFAGVFIMWVRLSLSCISAEGASLRLAWNPCPVPAFESYHVYYGPGSRDYNAMLDAGTNCSITVEGLDANSTYFFALTAYDDADQESNYTDEIRVTVPMLPVIFCQPSSQIAQAGAGIVLFIDVMGTPPLGFQWFNGNAPVAGGVNSILSLSQLSDTNAGDYTVVVTDSAGTVTSATATVTVIDPPPAGALLGVAGLGSAAQTLAAPVPAVPMSLAAGTYNGLFYHTNPAGMPAITVETTGLLNQCAVDAQGNFRGTIYLDGGTNSLSGAFDNDGNGSAIIDRAAAGLSNLEVRLLLDLTSGALGISGLVSNMNSGNPWTAVLCAESQSNGPSESSNLVLTIPPTDAWPAGFATATESDGSISLSGTLGDGAAFLQRAAVSKNGIVPLLIPLYHNQGLLAGWLNISGNASTSALTWIRPTGRVHPGFTNVVEAAVEAGK